jgi:hypothetical protein
MNLINRGRPNEHHDTTCMLNLQGIARFMVAILILLLISMSFVYLFGLVGMASEIKQRVQWEPNGMK